MNYIIFFFVVFSISAFYVIYYYRQKYMSRTVFHKYENLESNITSLYSVRIGDEIYVASIFYDERLSKIVINAPRLKPNISVNPCVVIYSTGRSEKCIIYEENVTLIYVTERILLINVTSGIPTNVILNNYNFAIFPYYKQIIKYKLTMCICKMVNISSVNRIIQTIESYILFGVDHFTIYKSSCSEDVEKVLNYYKNNHLLEIITWDNNADISLFKGSIYGQIYKLYDCTYRHQYDSEYIVVTDLDEIIWPLKGDTIIEMIDYLDKNNKDKYKYDVFYFRQRFYHQEWLEMFDRFVHNISDTDQFYYQEYCEYRGGHLQKQIYNPRAIIYPSLHYIKKGMEDMKLKWVALEEGYTRHTRRIRKDHLYGCESRWIMGKHDPREVVIQKKVKEVEDKLNIHPILNLEKLIFGNDSKYVYSEGK